MIHLQVSESDWLTTGSYWKDLCKHVASPDDQKKVQFLNKIIFESSGLNKLSQPTDTTTTEIPSISTMNEIMKEIDHDVAITTKATKNKNNKKQNNKNDKIKIFIAEAVKIV